MLLWALLDSALVPLVANLSREEQRGAERSREEQGGGQRSKSEQRRTGKA